MNIRPLRTVLAMPMTDKCLLLESLTMLGAARTAVVMLPFRWVATVLGKQEPTIDAGDDTAVDLNVRRVGTMVRRASKNVPWTSKCLDQAIAAKLMLARRGLPTTVYFGVRTDKNGELTAHAWLRSGSQFVTGGGNHHAFTIINTFTDGA
jgi:hypothetical protein